MRLPRQVRESILSLSAVQLTGVLIPLVTLPYLVRILGPTKYGAIAFAQAFVQYFVILTDYGFLFSATREVSVHRHDRHKLTQIFWSVLSVKALLLVVGGAIFTVIIVAFQRFWADAMLFVIVFGFAVGNALFPSWFFQGMERMRYLSAVYIGAMALSTVMLFVFVHDESDYLIAAAVQAGGMVAAGVIGFAVALRRFGIRWVHPGIGAVIHQLRDGWHVFLSQASISLYTSSNVVFLGLLASEAAVAYYVAAEKVIRAVHMVLAPLSQAIYPHIGALAASSREAAIQFIRKSLRGIGSLAFLASIVLWLFAEPVVTIALGDRFAPAVVLIRWMSFLPFIIALSNIFGIQTMLNLGMQREFTRVVLASGILNIAIIVPLVLLWRQEGAAVAALITEISVTAGTALVLRHRGVRLIASVRQA